MERQRVEKHWLSLCQKQVFISTQFKRLLKAAAPVLTTGIVRHPRSYLLDNDPLQTVVFKVHFMFIQMYLSTIDADLEKV